MYRSRVKENLNPVVTTSWYKCTKAKNRSTIEKFIYYYVVVSRRDKHKGY